MPIKVFKFLINYISDKNEKEDCVIGVINDNEKRIDMMEYSDTGRLTLSGIIPFSSIKKAVIIEEVGEISH